MFDNKKKFLIIIIIGAVVIIGGVLYFIKMNEEAFSDFEEIDVGFNNVLEEGDSEKSNQIESIENEEGSFFRDGMESVINNHEKIIVHIAGQVQNPGVISLQKGARIIDAINKAGGTTRGSRFN